MHISSLIKINGESSEFIISISEPNEFAAKAQSIIPTDKLPELLQKIFLLALKNYVTDTFVPNIHILVNDENFAIREIAKSAYYEISRVFIIERACKENNAKKILADFERRLQVKNFAERISKIDLGTISRI